MFAAEGITYKVASEFTGDVAEIGFCVVVEYEVEVFKDGRSFGALWWFELSFLVGVVVLGGWLRMTQLSL